MNKKPFYIVDIGGTFIKFGISSISKEEPLFIIRTPNKRENIVATISKVIQEFDRSYQYEDQIADTVMISCPGLINEDGYIEKALYIDLSGVNLKSILDKSLHRNIKIVNDAKIQTIGRYTNNKALLYMCIGTAVGGGFCSKQGLFIGGHGKTCEFGHVLIRNNNIKCYCGREGCLDTIVSGKAMIDQLGENWWEKTSVGAVKDYIKKAALATCEALETLALLFDPDEICVCGSICKVDLFRREMEGLWEDNKWSDAWLDLVTDTWQYVYKGFIRLYNSVDVYTGFQRRSDIT